MKTLLLGVLLGLISSRFCLADFPVEITIDKEGDYIQAPYNTVRNDSAGTLFPTVEQGGGKGQELRKTGNSRQGSFGLEFVLPPFDPSSGDIGEDWPRTLAHELGHYLFFLHDNYLGLDDNDQLIPVTCPIVGLGAGGVSTSKRGEASTAGRRTRAAGRYQRACRNS